MTLTARIVALVVLALLPAIAVQSFNEHALRAAREDAVRAMALRLARSASDDLSQFAASTRQIMDVLAEEPAIRGRDAATCGVFLQSIVGKIAGAIVVVVTDAEGVVACNSRGAAAGSYSIADRSYFRKAMESGEPVIGEYVVGRATGRPTIQFAYPLQDAAGAATGLINIGFNPDWLAGRLTAGGLPRDAALTVTDRSGAILVRSPDSAPWVGQPAPAAFLAALTDAGAAGGVIEMTGLGGDSRITGVVRPGGALDGMMVSAGIGRDAAFADIDAATRLGITMIVTGTLAAIAAALMVGRAFIRKPVRRLLKACRHWRAGDLTARSGLAGSSEFGQLGRAFDEMAAALQSHETDLRSELTRSRALQEQQVTLMHELNHRVKNTLATVQSLARQSKGGEAQAAQLEARILALSKTHDLLTRDGWTGATLRAVLESELDPYRNGADHLTLDGPEVDLPPRYVLALGMTAHELTTNAAKYGALSVAQGHVSVTWRTEESPGGPVRLVIEWRERGGPMVSPPQRRGFGTRLITGGVARELAGQVRLQFDPEGLLCVIDVPLEALPLESLQARALPRALH